jgi:septum formation protein
VIDPPAVSEDEIPGETPEAHVERLARRKASAVVARHPFDLVLAGDTVVVRDGTLVGKPESPAHAVDTLLTLAGRTHQVLTGIALAVPPPGAAAVGQGGAPEGAARIVSRVDQADVRFRPFDRAAAEAYVATGEPLDKAGAYAIQGRGAALVSRVEGDYSTVVGLPVPGFLALLEHAGYRYSFGGLVVPFHPPPENPDRP